MCGSRPCARPDCTWSQHHLQACEARHVASQPYAWRNDYYEIVGKKRGAQALAELKQRVGQAWKAAQTNSGESQ